MKNRQFVVCFYNLETDEVNTKIVRTLKHLSDWMNSLSYGICITNIDEIAGDPKYDKFFKESKNDKQS